MSRKLLRCLRYSVLLLLATGASFTCQAQIGLLTHAISVGTSLVRLSMTDPQFYVKGPGSYQLMAHDWQPAPVLLNNTGVTAGKGKEAQFFGLQDVRQVVVRNDTFAVVHQVKFPDEATTSAVPVIGRRVWRRPQVEVFDYYSAAGALPLLRFPDGKAAVLPKKPKEFRAAMLQLVGDHPALAEQLRKGELDAGYTRSILEAYLRWKPAGFNAEALLAPQPAK